LDWFSPFSDEPLARFEMKRRRKEVRREGMGLVME
jgi:hypothetical protein